MNTDHIAPTSGKNAGLHFLAATTIFSDSLFSSSSFVFRIISLGILSCSCFAAEKSDWVEGGVDGRDGANREYYNQAALLPWQNYMGDWRDAGNVPQGPQAYSEATVEDDDSIKNVRWDITKLADAWQQGQYPIQGVLLSGTAGRGRIVFASRESDDQQQHPTLLLTTGGKTTKIICSADTWLTKSTYRSQGQSAELKVSTTPEHLLLKFDSDRILNLGKIEKAELLLTTTQQYGSLKIGVFRCAQGHDDADSKPIEGLAAAYPADRGIEAHPDVIFATGFEDTNWQDEWTQVEPEDRINLIQAKSPFQKFKPLQGWALQSRIAKGSTTALNTLYRFEDRIGEEPEEIYFRYYLRLADDWNQTVQGGKLPGISGTYGQAGWGGRKSDGINGWSARGLFRMTIPTGNPLAGTTPIGFYCYHADMSGSYGTNWIWQRGYRGYLTKNRWYAIEQYCRLNTPDKRDGILRAWVDGRPAFEKTDIRFRLSDRLKIEQIWMNVYHGGTIPSPHDQHVFIDNVVVARQYIGPATFTP